MTDFSTLTAPGINDLHPYVPGKPIEELERELGLSGTIKLASNENPLGPSPLGAQAAADVIADINLYPDDSGYRLKKKLADRHGLRSQELVLGAGSSDVIDMVARSFLAPGRNAVFSRYSFAMYPIYTTAAGAQCRVADACPADHATMPYGHDLDAMAELVDGDTRVVFIANPNNPTGTWLTKDRLYAFLQKLRDDVIVVLDEAYTEYVTEAAFPNGVAWLAEFPNLIVTRTFSKIYGLAGLRVGYGMASAPLVDLISRVRHPFNVSMPALAAAEAALEDVEFLRRSRDNNDQGLAQLAAGFQTLGLDYIPSAGNFITVNLRRNAGEIYQKMLENGVIVRPVANYDLPEHLRVTVGAPAENRRFLEVLERVLAP
ncbi:histidinol-phosphate transaminase [Thiolapillus brandeum]|uniref:Histidinol-phosphate aminotransferase n=1 Tax=Thiolapillus brandeum TaxID=1076588 RepID=A0A7U6GJY3_9GAMM|nr:histidinol-phosphate transaminase [Thiolapillus brandeum]BAO45032.1 histidinol-phosphate aminotransferase [Thiolapillus brandeum]